jgi:hypothetical protein
MRGEYGDLCKSGVILFGFHENFDFYLSHLCCWLSEFQYSLRLCSPTKFLAVNKGLDFPLFLCEQPRPYLLSVVSLLGSSVSCCWLCGLDFSLPRFDLFVASPLRKSTVHDFLSRFVLSMSCRQQLSICLPRFFLTARESIRAAQIRF